MDQQLIIDLLRRYGYDRVIASIQRKKTAISIQGNRYYSVYKTIQLNKKGMLLHALGMEMTGIPASALRDSVFYNYDHLCICAELGLKMSYFKRHPCALLILLKDIAIPTLNELKLDIVSDKKLLDSWNYLFNNVDFHQLKLNCEYIISKFIEKGLLLNHITKDVVLIPRIKFVNRLRHYKHPIAKVFELKNVNVNELLGRTNPRRKCNKDYRSTCKFRVELLIVRNLILNKRLLRLYSKRNTLIMYNVLPIELCSHIASYI